MTADRPTADPIPDVFPPDRIDARFVIAMSMARNDIEFALRDGIAAEEEDRQDFTYRVRLVTSHLVEALDSLNAYTQHPDVTKLMARVPSEPQKQLSEARSVLQTVGSTVLDQVRNNTFHFPSPRTNYKPSSDEQLRDVLVSIGNRPCEVDGDFRGKHPVITLTFAGDVALALALAKHSADATTARQQFQVTHVGAVAFKHWVDALLVTYLGETGRYLGTRQPIEDANFEAASA